MSVNSTLFKKALATKLPVDENIDENSNTKEKKIHTIHKKILKIA